MHRHACFHNFKIDNSKIDNSKISDSRQTKTADPVKAQMGQLKGVDGGLDGAVSGQDERQPCRRTRLPTYAIT